MDEDEHQADKTPPSGEWAGSSGVWDPASDGVRYRERSVLGTGGMGRVVLAEDLVLRREVALKAALGDPDGPEAQRLRREARITAALDHPAIVPVYDLADDDDGRPYYVMRLVRGQTLAAAIAAAEGYAGRLALLRSFLTACEAVAFAHEAGVIHRDLKPDNILVGPWGETQVMDWGLARTLDADDWDAVVSRDFRTRHGAILGTPAYMSPEQASGGEVAATMDVWALGAVLYEILAGQRAIRGPSDKEMIAQILSGSRPPLTSLVPDVDPGLAAIVDRAMATDPSARFPDAGSLARALEAWLDRPHTVPKQPRPRLGVLVGVALLAGAVGWALAPSGPPTAVPDPSEDVTIVQDGLVVQAWAAVDDGDYSRAEDLAADALERGDHPQARGVLAATGLFPVPQLAGSAPLPDCPRAVVAPQAGFVVCSGDSLQVLELDGTVRWSLPAELERVHVDGSESQVVGYSRAGQRWLLLDASNGSAVTHVRLGFGLSLPRAGLSLVPGTHIGMQNGRDPHFLKHPVRAHGSTQSLHGCDDAGGVEWALEQEEERFLLFCADRSVRRSTGGEERPFLDATRKDSIVWTGALDSERRWLALGGVEGDIELIDLESAARVLTLDLAASLVRAVGVLPGGSHVVALDARGMVQVVPAARPDARVRIPGRARDVAVSESGEIVVLRGDRIERWRMPPSVTHVALDVPTGVMDLDWSERGLAVSASDLLVLDPDGAVRQRVTEAELVVAATDGAPKAELRAARWGRADDDLYLAGYGMGLQRVALDGRSVLASSASWVQPLPSGHIVFFGRRASDPAVLRPDGSTIDGLWVPGWQGLSGTLGPSGDRGLLSDRLGNLLRMLDGSPPRFEPVPPFEERASAAMTDDGTTLYASLAEGIAVRAADGATGSARVITPDVGGLVHLSRDERWLYVGGIDGLLTVLSLPEGRVQMQIQAHDRRISAIEVSPDGTRLATGSWDRTLRFWDLAPLTASPEELVLGVRARWASVEEPAPPAQ